MKGKYENRLSALRHEALSTKHSDVRLWGLFNVAFYAQNPISLDLAGTPGS